MTKVMKYLASLCINDEEAYVIFRDGQRFEITRDMFGNNRDVRDQTTQELEKTLKAFYLTYCNKNNLVPEKKSRVQYNLDKEGNSVYYLYSEEEI